MTEPGVIRINEIPVPVINENQVLLRIKRIGVCGSDIHVWHGKHPFTSYPVVQGHEFCAVIEETGEKVKDKIPGMLVTATPQIVCEHCHPCLRGDYNICESLKVKGFQAPGFAQDMVAVDASDVVVLPDNFSLEDGAFIEPLAVAVHSTGRVGELKGKNVVVFGAGTIGNLIAQASHTRGAANVLITDISNYRLNIAKKCGIKHVCNVAYESFDDAVKKVFGDEGFQTAFECAGIEATITTAVESIEKGGTIVIVGVFADKAGIDLSLVGDRELILTGTLMYKREDYDQAVKWISKSEVSLRSLDSKHFDFGEYAQAYKYIEKQSDKSMKVFIDL